MAEQVSTTFRTATPAPSSAKSGPSVEAQNPDRPSVEVNAPIALYEEVNGRPYAVDYFDVEGIWDDPDLDMRDDMQLIDKAYRSRVQNQKIKDGTDTYKAFIQEAEKATNTKNAPTSVKVAKLAEYVKFMEGLYRIDRNVRKYGIN